MGPAVPFRRDGWVALAVAAVCRALLGVLAGLAFWSLAPAALGWQPTVVMSASMAPRLLPGDVVVSRPVPASELRPGQVLLVDDPDHVGRLRLHRLVERDGPDRLVLRGDANPAADSSPVTAAAVHGVGALRVPYAGKLALWFATGDVRALALALGGAVLLVAGSAAYRNDGDGSGPPPAPGARAVPLRRRRVVGVAAVAVLLAGVGSVVGSPPVGAARFAGATQATGSAWSATKYLTCRAAALGPSPFLYYPLDETLGLLAVDGSGNGRNGSYQGLLGVTFGAAGPCTRDPSTAATFNGSSGWVSTPTSVAGPNVFTLETWFRTTTTKGGELIGFGNTQLTTPTSYDRHLYLANSGQVVFGVYPGAVRTVVSPRAYNDGGWHHAAATLSSAGMRLYVDGALVASDPSTTTAQSYTGYWRVGYNNLTNWGPTVPTSHYFAGSMAHVAVYSSALSPSEVAAHYAAG